ncbi:MAG: hypothetical protein ABEJ65_06565 [bacterium]
MVDRDRPRLNITLDADVKQRIRDVADDINVSTSRLIEAITREFLQEYEDNPMLGNQFRKEISDRRYKTEDTAESGEEEEAKQEIQNILEEFQLDDSSTSTN